MKQLLSLFLFLVPCLALAQYPSNGNQKITLGEQTTADGLIFRGVASIDTVRKPSIDTMAYMVLDTTTNIMWHYKKATSNAWLRVGGSISSGLTGVLPVANGGTNASTFTEGSVVFAGASGTYTQDNSNLFFDNTNNRLGVGKSNPTATLDITGPSSSRAMAINGAGNGPYFSFSTGDTTFADIGSLGSLFNNYTDRFDYVINTRSVFGIPRSIQLQTAFTTRLTVAGDGNVGIGTTSPTQNLHVVGNARITAVGSGTFSNNLNITSDGTLTTATSDEKFKYNIRPLNYGLSTLLQLKPVNFQWIEGEEEDLGFIAQDVAEIIPEAVNTNWNSDLLFRYESLIPILTKAIQEQQAIIKSLEQRIINLENK